jgi:hypothetical protein
VAAKKKTSTKRADPAPKRGVGRPTKRTPEVVGILMRALRCGCSRRGAAAIAGIGETTVKEWQAADPEFRLACEKAEGVASARLAASLFKRARKGDTTALIWWQKCRDPDFREVKEQPTDLGVGDIRSIEDVSRVLLAALTAAANGRAPTASLKDLSQFAGQSVSTLELAQLQKEMREIREILDGKGRDAPRS